MNTEITHLVMDTVQILDRPSQILLGLVAAICIGHMKCCC